MRNPQNGESRGFGFVAMKYEEVRAVRCTPCCARVMRHDRLRTSRVEVARQLALELAHQQGSAGVEGLRSSLYSFRRAAQCEETAGVLMLQ